MKFSMLPRQNRQDRTSSGRGDRASRRSRSRRRRAVRRRPRPYSRSRYLAECASARPSYPSSSPPHASPATCACKPRVGHYTRFGRGATGQLPQQRGRQGSGGGGMLDSHNIYYGTNEWVSQAGRSSGFPTRDGAFDAASQNLRSGRRQRPSLRTSLSRPRSRNWQPAAAVSLLFTLFWSGTGNRTGKKLFAVPARTGKGFSLLIVHNNISNNSQQSLRSH